MYSKRKVCFTVVLAVGFWPSFNSNRDTVRVGSHGPRLTVADGTQPPPPIPPPKLGSTGLLQADGTQPPPPILPPPKSGSAARLRAAAPVPSAPWRSPAPRPS